MSYFPSSRFDLPLILIPHDPNFARWILLWTGVKPSYFETASNIYAGSVCPAKPDRFDANVAYHRFHSVASLDTKTWIIHRMKPTSPLKPFIPLTLPDPLSKQHLNVIANRGRIPSANALIMTKVTVKISYVLLCSVISVLCSRQFARDRLDMLVIIMIPSLAYKIQPIRSNRREAGHAASKVLHLQHLFVMRANVNAVFSP